LPLLVPAKHAGHILSCRPLTCTGAASALLLLLLLLLLLMLLCA
jgi:hypothetical protein